MNELLAGLQTMGDAVTRWVIWMNVWCAAIAAGAVIADRLLARRVSPGWRMALYAAVFVRMALPVSWDSPVGVAPRPPETVRISMGQTGQVEDLPIVTAGDAALLSGGHGAAFTLSALAVPVYALGVLGLCGIWIAGATRLRRVVRESRLVETGAGGVGSICEHERAGPLLVGVWRPLIVVPRNLKELVGEAGMACVLRHEHAHVVRRDPLVACLLHAVVITTWPVIAVWVAAARIRALMEEACDERAVRGGSRNDRELYGETLVRLASRRVLPMLTPVLPFGSNLRARVRALTGGTSWPVGVQLVLVTGVAALLVACAGSRGDQPEQLRATTRLENAEAEAFKGSLPIRVTILRSWPDHPKLDFNLGQYREGAEIPDMSIHRILTREEAAELLRGAQHADEGAVMSRPRLEVVPGMKATVSIGTETQGDKIVSGIMLDSTVTLVEIPAGSNRRMYTMDLDFNRYGDKRTASSAQVRGVKVPQGETVALLATGYIGGERLLVCVSPGPDEVQTRFSAEALPAVADTRPLIAFTARIHRVDAPKDYGSPKGDGPRQKWSALPGGAEMSAAEFKTYLEELKGRPGYVLLAAPQVWVHPGQEATVELSPEPETPGTTQIVRLKGSPDGSGVRCTGSYARLVKGMSTEGSWNRPRVIEPDGAMVWSIHDPDVGAWYTVTIQAKVHAAGSIKPQTAGMPGK